ncbi:MAG: hypothetical protein P1U61_00155 [Legionellaceae bacterium]|nr:hypothetical protein [Legionellaceae bacterium]
MRILAIKQEPLDAAARMHWGELSTAPRKIFYGEINRNRRDNQ